METYSVSPHIRKESIRKKDGKAPVILLVGINSDQRKISTGIYIEPRHWNDEARKIRKSHPDHNDLNVEIRQRVANANDIFKYYRRRDMPLSIEVFLQEYHNPGSRKDFLQFLNIKIERRFELGEITRSTYIKHKGVWKKLSGFRKKIPFQIIDKLFLEDFDLWHLRKLRQEVGEKLVNDGAGPRNNASKIIRAYLNIAQGDGIEFDMPKIVTKISHPEAPFLRKGELMNLVELYDHPLNTPSRWHEVMRCFLGMCFSGMSYTDAQDLDWTQIREGVLTYVRNKQRRYQRQVTIPVMPILSKFLGDPQTSGLVFKTFSEPYFNRELKLIGKHLNFKIKLTSKVARDTFGTLYAEETGGDIMTLMQLMGHSKIETTAKYIHLSESHKFRQMEKVFGEFL